MEYASNLPALVCNGNRTCAVVSTPRSPWVAMTNDMGPLLLVDDDVANREMLSRRLTRSGFIVDSVASGFEALEYIDSRLPDLVLLDGEMPGMNGLRVLQEYPPRGDASAPKRVSAKVRSATRLPRRVRMTASGTGTWRPGRSISRRDGRPSWDSDPDSVGEDPQEWFDRIHPDDQPACARTSPHTSPENRRISNANIASGISRAHFDGCSSGGWPSGTPWARPFGWRARRPISPRERFSIH